MSFKLNFHRRCISIGSIRSAQCPDARGSVLARVTPPPGSAEAAGTACQAASAEKRLKRDDCRPSRRRDPAAAQCPPRRGA